MSARFAAQWTAICRLKRSATADVDDRARHLLDTICGELGVHRAIRFLRSRLAEVPMVVGWFSPVVVVPVSALTSLTPDQLRAVLAHKPAHIRRYDYLINGIQSIIEIILFFHPAVWWLSARIRHERERCCDDIAVRSAGNPIVFAKALSRLEALREEASAPPCLGASCLRAWMPRCLAFPPCLCPHPRLEYLGYRAPYASPPLSHPVGLRTPRSEARARFLILTQWARRDYDDW